MANQPGNPNMKVLIPMINELQRIFTMVNTRLTLTLPQIAVVGSQSAGKSSVLENIVGRDFLPRGGSMVTKRPLVLQLITSQGQEYGVFGHKPQQRFTNYADIRNEIENDTKAVVRDNMGVSNLPINLTIYSPHVVNLTLVDLPGMVKVPSHGQPADIAKRIDDIILEYISNENCLILAVTPGTIDLVTSDALVMARSKDPMGKRTIGVLTKLDMMGQGHNARDVLLNKVVVLERGFIGVVLRGQRVDGSGRVMRELDIPAAIEFERQFFLNDPAYRDIADRMGVPFLQSTLSIQLTEHILKCLPSLKKELQERHHDLAKEVSLFRTSAMFDGSSLDTKALVALTHELQEDFETALRGTNLKESDLKTLTGGARIANIFRERFPYELTKVDLHDKDMRDQLIVAIKNIRGLRSGLFTPDEAFEYVIQMQITKFEEPILKCVDMIILELMSIVQEVTGKLKGYPILQRTTEELLTDYLKEREVITKQACSLYVHTQLAYINTINEDFIGFTGTEKSTSATEVKRQVTNQIIRKGFLRVHTGAKLFQAKDYFFILTTDNLSWFSDSDERDKKYMLPLENLKLRDVEGGFMAKRLQFALFHTEGKNVYRDDRSLKLSVDNAEELENWKASFFRAGIYPERGPRVETTATTADTGPADPHMERQVETVSILVASYMQIVTKTTRDFIPKMIMYNSVQELRKYVSRELLANLYAVPDPKALLQESVEERHRRQAKIAEFEAVKSALTIIENFHFNAHKVTTAVMSTSAMTTAFSNTTMNNHFEQSSNHSTNLFDNSFGTGANRFPSHHLQRNQSTTSSFTMRDSLSPGLRPSLSDSTYRNGSATPPLSHRPVPPVPPRPYDRPPPS
jgi:replication fork clamp-binding protein CrfC